MRICKRGACGVAVMATVLSGALLGGCASYVTPGSGASFREMGITPTEQAALTDYEIREKMDLRPLANFPCAMAVVRVQGAGYRSYTSEGWGRGKFTVITARDVETEQDFTNLAGLPMVSGVAPLNRLVLPDQLENERQLRTAAASVQADMLLVYTIDTKFGSETTIPAMGLITLGLFPNKEAKVTSTATSALIDTRNGYIYGLAEHTARTDQLANAWTTRSAIDQSRRRAERQALDGMFAQISGMWPTLVARYAVPQAPVQPLPSPSMPTPPETVNTGTR